MRVVTKYVSDDGREFLAAPECIQYEALCKEVDEIMAPLGMRPDLPGCGFENGDGYLQHDPVVVAKVRNALLKIANTIMPHKWFDQSIADHNADPSWAGRLIGEMSERCLVRAWNRFSCIGAGAREYGQPFYAAHPERVKPVCLNGAA
jgi:hypothetical protein